ncbi:MAG: STAS domain-containing protein [Chloroflexota bacterium]
MRLTQHQIHLGILGIIALTLSLITIFEFFNGDQNMVIIGVTGLVVLGALLFATWKHWFLNITGPITIVVVSLIVIAGALRTTLDGTVFLALLFPPLIANLIAGPSWVLGSSLTVATLIFTRAQLDGTNVDPMMFVMYCAIVGGIILSRLATDNVQRLEEANKRVAQALAQAEQQAHANKRQAEELVRQNEAQQRLLELVATLETPTVTMATGILFAPIVGYIDSQRADRLIAQLLDDASNQRARLVILDIAGVPTIDTATAQTILHATSALRLLGCQVALTGISPEIAVTLTHLDVDLSTITTVPTPQEAVQRYTEQTLE